LSDIEAALKRADGARTPDERIAVALEGILLELGAMHACQRRQEKASRRIAGLLSLEHADIEDDDGDD
jgi:hypothetical protein